MQAFQRLKLSFLFREENKVKKLLVQIRMSLSNKLSIDQLDLKDKRVLIRFDCSFKK